MKLRWAASLLALVLAFTACAEEEVLVSRPTATSLRGTRWVVTGFLLDGAGGRLPAGIHLSLDFDDTGGIGGTAGCNSYFGAAALTAGGIAVTGIGSTEMACEPEVMEREMRFLTALGRVTGLALEGEGLRLTAGDGSASIDLVPLVPEPDRPLAGTTWLLTTLIDGDAASSIIAGTEPTLVVDDLEERISGSTGCNRFFGSATFAVETVTVGLLRTTKMACDAATTEQESFVLAVLGAAATWEIEGARLRITAADGRALEFVAG